MHRTLFMIAAGLVLLVAALPVAAQSLFLPDPGEEGSRFGVRWLRPEIDALYEMSTFSGNYDLHLAAAVGRGLRVVSDLPIGSYSWGPEGDRGQTAVGNVYLGLTTNSGSRPGHPVCTRVGLYLPTTGDASGDLSIHMLSVMANIHEIARHAVDALVIDLGTGTRAVGRSGVFAGPDIGSELWIPIRDRQDTEALIRYGFSGGVRLTHVAFVTEILGLFVATEDTGDVADRFSHSLAFGIGLVGLPVLPTVQYLVPLDKDIREDMSGALGVRVDVVLR